MENSSAFNPALPWEIYTINTADSTRFCAYNPPSRVPLLHYRAPAASSFTYAHFPSAFPPIILPTVRMHLPYPPFSMREDGTTEHRMTDAELLWRTLVAAVLSRSAARSVDPFTGPAPLVHTRVVTSLARGDRNDTLSVLMSRGTRLSSLRSLATSMHTRWRHGGRRLFVAGIIILLLVAAFRRCRRARRFIHYLLRKVLKFYRQCWRRFYDRSREHDDASDRSGSSGTSGGRSQDRAGHGRRSMAGSVQADSPAAGRREEDEVKTQGKTSSANGQHSRCMSAPGSLVTPAEGKERGGIATGEGWLGLPHWGGFRGNLDSAYRTKLGIRPSSFSTSSFARGVDMGTERRRGLKSLFCDSSGKSTSSSIHRALHDFSLYIEASAHGGLHQCPAPTNTNIPSCFFLPSLVSAASPSPGAEAEAVAAAAAGGAGAPAGAHSRFCECCCSQVAGAQGLDATCIGSTCPYSTRTAEPVMIFQEAIYSSDSSPPASVCQGESSLTRVTEEATGHDSASVKSPRTPGTLTGEAENLRSKEIGGIAALFRHAALGRTWAPAAVFGRDVQKKSSEHVKRPMVESGALHGSLGASISGEIVGTRSGKKRFHHGQASKSFFAIRWAVVKRRLHRLYKTLLDLLRRRMRKHEPAKVPPHEPLTKTPETPASEDSANVELDSEALSYFQKLYRLVRLAFPGLWSYEGGCLVLLVSALVLRTFLSIWIASINGNVVQTIVQRNLAGFVRSLGVLIAYALPAAVVNAAIQFFEKMLALQLRRNLTIYLTRRYLKGLTFYRVAALDCRIPHPDEVMTASLSSFSLLTASLLSSFLKPLVDIVFLSRTLVKHLGIGAPVTLVAWYALTAFAMHAVAPPLGKRTARLQELEAKYRALHGDVLQHSEEIAFYGGARHAERRLQSAFDILYAYKRQVLMLYHLVLSSMDTLLAKHLAVVVGYAVVAGPSFTRAGEEGRSSAIQAVGSTSGGTLLWKAGSAGSGIRTTEVAVTHDYIRNSSLLINLAKAIGRILMAYKDVQQLGGITARLNAFLLVLEDLDSGFFCTRDVLTGALSRRSTISKGTVNQLSTATAVQFKDVAVVTPAGQVLLDHVSFALPSGHNLFLLGPNGCGKTSLFRILGGLWPLLEGEITIPTASKLFYIPQRPYMPEGTLRDQVIYPMTYEDYKSLPAESDRLIDDQLEHLLDIVGLNYVLKRCPEGWDTWGDWEDILSGGEKQRVAFARLLFHKPIFAILDEATSAVSVDLEGALYRRCAEAKITLITISHNITLLKYHDFVLRFSGVGAPGRRWSLESTEGLKRLDSYSFLLNIPSASIAGDATHFSPYADSLILQCPPGPTTSLPSARSGEKLLLPNRGSPLHTAALNSSDSAGQHQPGQQGNGHSAKDVDTHLMGKSGSSAPPHVVLLSPTSGPNGGTERSAVFSSNASNASQTLTPLPSRGSRVSSPARADGRAFSGAPSSLTPAAVGSAAATATVSTIMSMRKNQQDTADSQQ